MRRRNLLPGQCSVYAYGINEIDKVFICNGNLPAVQSDLESRQRLQSLPRHLPISL